MHKVLGGCHCGNVSYVAEMQNEPSTYNSRSCDCKFCTIHGASYTSDSWGTLVINIKNESEVSKYRQGSKIADFIICKNCGVLTNVLYKDEGNIFGSINVRSVIASTKFGESHVSHLAQLGDEERIKRWKEVWFSNVKIKGEIA